LALVKLLGLYELTSPDFRFI